MQSLLVLGGARSGKSRYAEARCTAHPGPLAYIATAQAFDSEMTDRIALHQTRRDDRWTTWEAPLDLPATIAIAAQKADAILVDCLTLWLSNLMLAESDIPAATTALAEAIAQCPIPIALVANEVGFGIVPDNALARRFRDEAGLLNQKMATLCKQVVLVTAGLPLTLKG